MDTILVSVVMIAYNSEKYIIQALESVKNQTYKNIQLIISDDASSDNTNNLIEEWLKENGNNFKSYRYNKNIINLGIVDNLNIAIKLSSGLFIKLLAADDILFGNAIFDLLHFCIDNQLNYCFSKVLPFSDIDSKKIKSIVKNDAINSERFFNKNNIDQYRSLLILNTPLTFILGGFYKREIFDKVGYFNEKYQMQEDYSFALKLCALGDKFIRLETFTHKYRVRIEIDKDYKKNKRYIDGYNCMKAIREDYILNELLSNGMYFSFIYLKAAMFILHLEYGTTSKFVILIANLGRNIKQFIMNLENNPFK